MRLADAVGGAAGRVDAPLVGQVGRGRQRGADSRDVSSAPSRVGSPAVRRRWSDGRAAPRPRPNLTARRPRPASRIPPRPGGGRDVRRGVHLDLHDAARSRADGRIARTRVDRIRLSYYTRQANASIVPDLRVDGSRSPARLRPKPTDSHHRIDRPEGFHGSHAAQIVRVRPRRPKPQVRRRQRPSAEIRRVADLLKQVSDPTRLQVLMLLEREGAERLRTLRRPRHAEPARRQPPPGPAPPRPADRAPPLGQAQLLRPDRRRPRARQGRQLGRRLSGGPTRSRTRGRPTRAETERAGPPSRSKPASRGRSSNRRVADSRALQASGPAPAWRSRPSGGRRPR